MLKLTSRKRCFDAFENATAAAGPQCSPHKINFLESPNEASNAKRYKRIEDEQQDNTQLASRPSRPEHFPKFNFSVGDVTPPKWVEWCPKHRRRLHIARRSFLPTPDRNPEEPLFTLEDLHTIVQNALVEQQAHLQAGYDNILQQRLAEQFQSFTKFNEDHIHRQLKQSNYDYMS